MRNYNCDFTRFMIYFFIALGVFYWLEQKINIFLAFDFSLIVWIFDKVLDTKIKISDNILEIYDLSYKNLIENKPKVIHFNEIKLVKKSSFNLKCFTNILIQLKNGEIIFLNQAGISKADLKTLLAI